MDAKYELKSGLIEEYNVRKLAVSRATDVGTLYNRRKGCNIVQGPFYGKMKQLLEQIKCLEGSNSRTNDLPPDIIKELEALESGDQMPMVGQLTAREMNVPRWYLPLAGKKMTDFDFHLGPKEGYVFPSEVLQNPRWIDPTGIAKFEDPYNGTRTEILQRLRSFFEGIPQTFPLRTYENNHYGT